MVREILANLQPAPVHEPLPHPNTTHRRELPEQEAQRLGGNLSPRRKVVRNFATP
jgi:hypothetical protein